MDGRPVSAAVGGHVARCPRCAKESAAMRASLGAVSHAAALDSSEELTARILLEAQKLRAGVSPRRRRAAAMLWTAGRGMGFATLSLAAAILVFGAALGNPGPAPVRAASAPVVASEAAPSPDALLRTASTVKTLTDAVRMSPEAAKTPIERAKLNAVDAMSTDIVAARAALERNPGCVRASHIVHANLQRQAQTLRDLYVERAY